MCINYLQNMVIGLKIPRGVTLVPVQVRPRAPIKQ